MHHGQAGLSVEHDLLGLRIDLDDALLDLPVERVVHEIGRAPLGIDGAHEVARRVVGEARDELVIRIGRIHLDLLQHAIQLVAIVKHLAPQRIDRAHDRAHLVVEGLVLVLEDVVRSIPRPPALLGQPIQAVVLQQRGPLQPMRLETLVVHRMAEDARAIPHRVVLVLDFQRPGWLPRERIGIGATYQTPQLVVLELRRRAAGIGHAPDVQIVVVHRRRFVRGEGVEVFDQQRLAIQGVVLERGARSPGVDRLDQVAPRIVAGARHVAEWIDRLDHPIERVVHAPRDATERIGRRHAIAHRVVLVTGALHLRVGSAAVEPPHERDKIPRVVGRFRLVAAGVDLERLVARGIVFELPDGRCERLSGTVRILFGELNQPPQRIVRKECLIAASIGLGPRTGIVVIGRAGGDDHVVLRSARVPFPDRFAGLPIEHVVGIRAYPLQDAAGQVAEDVGQPARLVVFIGHDRGVLIAVELQVRIQVGIGIGAARNAVEQVVLVDRFGPGVGFDFQQVAHRVVAANGFLLQGVAGERQPVERVVFIFRGKTPRVGARGHVAGLIVRRVRDVAVRIDRRDDSIERVVPRPRRAAERRRQIQPLGGADEIADGVVSEHGQGDGIFQLVAARAADKLVENVVFVLGSPQQRIDRGGAIAQNIVLELRNRRIERSQHAIRVGLDDAYQAMQIVVFVLRDPAVNVGLAEHAAHVVVRGEQLDHQVVFLLALVPEKDFFGGHPIETVEVVAISTSAGIEPRPMAGQVEMLVRPYGRDIARQRVVGVGIGALGRAIEHVIFIFRPRAARVRHGRHIADRVVLIACRTVQGIDLFQQSPEQVIGISRRIPALVGRRDDQTASVVTQLTAAAVGVRHAERSIVRIVRHGGDASHCIDLVEQIVQPVVSHELHGGIRVDHLSQLLSLVVHEVGYPIQRVGDGQNVAHRIVRPRPGAVGRRQRLRGIGVGRDHRQFASQQVVGEDRDASFGIFVFQQVAATVVGKRFLREDIVSARLAHPSVPREHLPRIVVCEKGDVVERVAGS